MHLSVQKPLEKFGCSLAPPFVKDVHKILRLKILTNFSRKIYNKPKNFDAKLHLVSHNFGVQLKFWKKSPKNGGITALFKLR